MTLRKANTDENNGSPDFYEYPNLIGMASIDIISNKCASIPLFHFDDPINPADYQRTENLSFENSKSDPFNFSGYFV